MKLLALLAIVVAIVSQCAAQTSNTVPGNPGSIAGCNLWCSAKFSTVTQNASTVINVTGATNASPIVITPANACQLYDGQQVVIASVGGNTNANGTFYAKVTGQTAPAFALYTTPALTTTVNGNAAYTSGGTITFNTQGCVSGWSDVSGAGNNLAQTGAVVPASIARRPEFKSGPDQCLIFDSHGAYVNNYSYVLDFPIGYAVNSKSWSFFAIVDVRSCDPATRTLVSVGSGNVVALSVGLDAPANSGVAGTNCLLDTLLIRYNSVTYNTGLRIPTGKHLVGVVFSSTNATVYLDDTSYSTGVAPPTATTTVSATGPVPVCIGNFGTTESGHQFIGNVYDVMAYSVPLTGYQVAQLVDYGVALGVCPHPTRQVLCDGDSISYGLYANLNATYPSLMGLSPADVKIWNMGVPSQGCNYPPTGTENANAGLVGAKITAVTSSGNVVITTNVAHNLADGNQVYIYGLAPAVANGLYYAKETTFTATTFGLYTSSGLSTPVTSGGAWTANNYAMAGGSASANLANLYNANLNANVVIIWVGTNDVNLGSRTNAQAQADIQDYCAVAHQIGWKVIVVDALPRNSGSWSTDANRLAFNALFFTNGTNPWQGYADGFVDIGADPVLGAFATLSDGFHYGDGTTHPTSVGYAQCASTIRKALLPLLYPMGPNGQLVIGGAGG